jgi:hypothetical protein
MLLAAEPTCDWRAGGAGLPTSRCTATVGEVLAMGDQPLMQLAGEHRDAVHPGVVPELWQVMQTLRLRVLSKTSLSR